MTIKIDKDIPIARSNRASKNNPIFPLADLEVGDSFLVPNPESLSNKVLRSRVNSLIHYYGKKLSIKFLTRDTSEGLRVWRIE